MGLGIGFVLSVHACIYYALHDIVLVTLLINYRHNVMYSRSTAASEFT